jgi:hypothetical protein
VSHPIPQEPQLLASVFRFTQIPSQPVGRLGSLQLIDLQAGPFVRSQVTPGAQTLPHPPQLF